LQKIDLVLKWRGKELISPKLFSGKEEGAEIFSYLVHHEEEIRKFYVPHGCEKEGVRDGWEERSDPKFYRRTLHCLLKEKIREERVVDGVVFIDELHIPFFGKSEPLVEIWWRWNLVSASVFRDCGFQRLRLGVESPEPGLLR
jgi:hypothetical protein